MIAVYPHELPDLLDRFSGIEVLSLDCFDTLLWRDCHAPMDLFHALPGLTLHQRAASEGTARRRAMMRNIYEVSLSEIHDALMPNASAAERAAVMEAELATEARHCFAFLPTVALMREAKARNIKIVIASDTYLEEKQLRGLLTASAGPEVVAMIDRIFCSVDYKKCKSAGLIGDVLKKMRVAPEAVLHIGDNYSADVEGMAPFGVHAVHLQQFSPLVAQRLRFESAVSAYFGDEGLNAPQLHRAPLAMLEPLLESPAMRFGAGALGPVIAGFTAWLDNEARELQANRSGNVHMCFVLRDGFLLHEAQKQFGSEFPMHSVAISRLTSFMATFNDGTELEHHIASEAGINPRSLARHLLMTDAEAERIIGDLDDQQGTEALVRAVREGALRRTLVRRSREIAQRLVRHIRETVRPEPGDTIMLVDVGSAGTVQNRIAHLLEKELNVHIAGRYALLREANASGLDKRGMLSVESAAFHLVTAVFQNIAVFEELWQPNHGSTIGYEQDGTPIFGSINTDATQSQVREDVQAGALALVGMAREIRPIRHPDDVKLWQRSAQAALLRLAYLPLPEEVEVIGGFKHDVNMGSNRTLEMSNFQAASTGLKMRGLSYIRGVERMYIPGELANLDLSTRLGLLNLRGMNMPLTINDLSGSKLTLTALFHDGDNIEARPVEAMPTHDGYYAVNVPLGEAKYTVELRTERRMESVELSDVLIEPMHEFMSGLLGGERAAVMTSPTVKNMPEPIPGVYDCRHPDAAIRIAAPADAPDGQLMATIAFRPLGGAAIMRAA